MSNVRQIQLNYGITINTVFQPYDNYPQERDTIIIKIVTCLGRWVSK